MENEIAIPKVNIVRRPSEGIKLCLGSLLLVVFCTFLIITATFVQFDVIHFIIPKGLFDGGNFTISDFIHTYKFIPQVPAIMFIAAFLGRKYGITSVVIYILAGLFFVPIFALGGGLKYIFEYSFGYILGYIPALFFAASILKSGYSNKNIFKAALIGVLTIHITGILYMFLMACIRHESWAFMLSWISIQSGVKIIYDFVLSFFAIFIARYFRVILWFYM